MPTTYIVNCFSPPNGYLVKTGDRVSVKGWIYEKKKQILADKITRQGAGITCKCGDVPDIPKEKERWEAEKAQREYDEKVGDVGKVEVSTLGLEFELMVS